MKEIKVVYRDNSLFWGVFCTFTAIVGVEVHNLSIWTLVDFFFAPIVWVYWLLTHQVTIQIIKDSFDFLYK